MTRSHGFQGRAHLLVRCSDSPESDVLFPFLQAAPHTPRPCEAHILFGTVTAVNEFALRFRKPCSPTYYSGMLTRAPSPLRRGSVRARGRSSRPTAHVVCVCVFVSRKSAVENTWHPIASAAGGDTASGLSLHHMLPSTKKPAPCASPYQSRRTKMVSSDSRWSSRLIVC